MVAGIDENTVVEAALEHFRQLGYKTIWGPGIAPDGTAPERADYGQVLLRGRLRDALERIIRSMELM
jgi:type I restriction enzyme R subunit